MEQRGQASAERRAPLHHDRAAPYDDAAMRLRFFRIPVLDSAAAEAELDRFLTSHRVIELERQLVVDGPRSWAICVGYVDATTASSTRPTADTKGSKRDVDYREVLSPDDFRVYALLRALRKTIAERDAVPAYSVFTNEQLAAMVTGRVRTAAELAKIPGIGQSRIDKHGAAFLAALHEADAVGPTTDPPPNGDAT